MMNLREWISSVRASFARRRFDAEMEEEMRFHLEMRAREAEAAGKTPREAQLAARRLFGNVGGIQEQCRDERGWRWLGETVKDIRYSARVLGRTPALTAVAALTLALGIGLVAIQLSFLQAAERGSLPIERPDRVLRLRLAGADGYESSRIAYRDYADWKSPQKSFAETGAFDEYSALYLRADNFFAHRYSAAALSSGVMRALRVRPVLGRAFNEEDDRAGARRVILLSYEIWTRDFGSDRGVLGRELLSRTEDAEAAKAGESATVIGVMPPEFGLGGQTECWYNLRAAEGATDLRVAVIGRLKDGVAPAMAQAELATWGREFSAPGAPPGRKRLVGYPLLNGISGRIRITLFTMLGVVGGVLALACVNVAVLLFLRAVERGRELAMRMALGATRGRLIRQMLAESSLLAALGAVLGGLFAWWGVALLERQLAADAQKPLWLHVRLDGATLAAVIGITVVVALAAGLAPALRAARLNANSTLKDGAWGAGIRLGRLTRSLVVLQTSCACCLLLVTGILVHGILQLGSVPLTFDPSRTLAVGLSPVPGRDPAASARVLESILEQSQALPGVEAATLADQDPMDNSNSEPIELQDSAGPARAGRPIVHWQVVSANFFNALNAPVKQGRGFTPADRAGIEPVALVNESLARRCWPGQSPVGKRFRVSSERPGEWLTVAGIVPDLPMQGVLNTGSPAGFYRPASQEPLSGAVLILRTRIDPHSLVAPLRRIIRRLDPDLPLDSIFTVEELRDRKLATPRAFGGLAAAFALSALVLAAVGIYGVTGFAVQRRTREFGIRLALGARPADLERLVLGRGLIHASLSLGAGALAGWAVSRPMVASMRDMIGAATPYTYLFVFGTLTAAVLLALWVPARKAARVDPAITLRAD